ncbi:leukemia inhibitory factor receptor isoform X1 [Channa argus]|uniref:leukemia inhibitory factor receptor isoform X1 n=1 Tax=Channa argus TaxID=215402 RepID=UPI0029463D59|nr:hypothetical protein Q8A73_019499 [Channa argus]
MVFLCKPIAPLILGLFLVYYTTLSSCVKGIPVNGTSDTCKEKLSMYQHCSFHPDGVRDLDCFKLQKTKFSNCVWKAGEHTSKKTHTLLIQQVRETNKPPHCKEYENLNEASASVTLYSKGNITAEVFENSGTTNCTKAVFRGNLSCLIRCSPPKNVSFIRHSGKLDIDVTWNQKDLNVESYFVRYKALGSPLWNESAVKSESKNRCTVENLNTSLIYFVQIHCVKITNCPHYPWSETYTVPPELTTKPEIVGFEVNDMKENGKQQLFLSWKFSAEQLHDKYNVSVGKAPEEPPLEHIITTQPEIRLILSYSDFHLSVRAVNNASTSPAASKTVPQRQDMSRFGDGRLNVTVHNKMSFTVHWKDDLIKTYVCYSVEWRRKGHRAVHKSFFQADHNYWNSSTLPEPLEPYKRYTITLHKRPNKDTCNMKRVNNSESTYGSTQFYLTEGTPVSAPANISSHNVTVSSVVLEWLPILEEDIRGFLLGYTIHYMKYPGGTERNITVDPTSKSYKVRDLESGTAFQVQISGFTRAGAGVRSTPSLFKTNNKGYVGISLSRIIPAFAVGITILIFGPSIIKRTKVIVWPSVPNPGNSNTMQKIKRTCELELLESINTLKVEEWDTNSLQIVEKETMIVDTFPHLHDSEEEDDSPEMTRGWSQRVAEDAAGDVLCSDSTGTVSNTPRTNLQSFPLAFPSEYTTMEMLNQIMPQSNPVDTDETQAEESEPESTDLPAVKLGLDYIGQFGTSPVSESEL